MEEHTQLETELIAALEAACGYMLNAKIQMDTSTKAKAGKILDDGQRLILAALSKAKRHPSPSAPKGE